MEGPSKYVYGYKNEKMLNNIKNSFYSRVLLPNENGCMEWIGELKNGYGRLKSCGALNYAHRLSYEIFIGKITDNLFVCHMCDNPKCVAPDHLFSGTCKDNMQDMAKKGRSMKGRKHLNPNPPNNKGINHPKAKLDNEKLKVIRDKIKKGEKFKKIALDFNVHWSLIYKIKNNQLWSSSK